jgi:hypothetical protein
LSTVKVNNRTNDLDLALKIHRERSRTQEYITLGRVVWICLEVTLPEGTKVSPRDRLLLGKLDYMNSGPLLAVSKDHQDLLLPYGALPFPDVPDPLWEKPMPTAAQLADPNWRAPQAPMIRQSMTERAAGLYTTDDKEQWVIFQPVLEIWYRLFNQPAYAVAKCRPFIDTRTALMINPETCEAFFYGGRPELH